MHLWTAPPGAAPHEEVPWTDLAPGPTLPSALDTIVPDRKAPEAVAESAALRTRWYLRPRLAVTAIDDGSQPDLFHADLGIAAGHQWWKFTDVAVAPAGETRLVATLPIGTPGYDLALSSAGGLWLVRRLGLFVGARGDADRTRWSEELTDRAIAVGPLARLALDFGHAHPWFEIDAGWIVDGDRPPIAGAPWDVLSERVGIVFGNRLQLKFEAAHESTGSGEVREVSAGIHLHIG
jgi:hypothetical protein